MFTITLDPIIGHVGPFVLRWYSLIGHPAMMQSKVSSLIPMLEQAGFINSASGRTRSVFLGFARGKKQ